VIKAVAAANFVESLNPFSCSCRERTPTTAPPDGVETFNLAQSSFGAHGKTTARAAPRNELINQTGTKSTESTENDHADDNGNSVWLETCKPQEHARREGAGRNARHTGITACAIDEGLRCFTLPSPNSVAHSKRLPAGGGGRRGTSIRCCASRTSGQRSSAECPSVARLANQSGSFKSAHADRVARSPLLFSASRVRRYGATVGAVQWHVGSWPLPGDRACSSEHFEVLGGHYSKVTRPNAPRVSTPQRLRVGNEAARDFDRLACP
jgi:hypothetical protein